MACRDGDCILRSKSNILLHKAKAKSCAKWSCTFWGWSSVSGMLFDIFSRSCLRIFVLTALKITSDRGGSASESRSFRKICFRFQKLVPEGRRNRENFWKTTAGEVRVFGRPCRELQPSRAFAFEYKARHGLYRRTRNIL